MMQECYPPRMLTSGSRQKPEELVWDNQAAASLGHGEAAYISAKNRASKAFCGRYFEQPEASTNPA
jgi:hypothetical protein